MLCEPSRKIREIDNQNGAEFSRTVGRIIGEGIEVRWTFCLSGAFVTQIRQMKAGITRSKGRPIVATTTSARPTLAPPKLKAGPGASTSAAAATAATKVEEKGKEPANDESKLKAKQTGKMNFFAPKLQSQVKEKETKSSKGKIFFGANDSSSKSVTISLAKEKVPESVPAPPPSLEVEKSKEIEPLKASCT